MFSRSEEVKIWLTSRSVVMRTLLEPERNSLMIKSLSFWSMSPCWNKTSNRYQGHPGLVGRLCLGWPPGGLTRAETVKSLACIFSVSQSTFLLVLMKITACVMVRVSYKSHSVSSFHSCRHRITTGWYSWSLLDELLDQTLLNQLTNTQCKSKFDYSLQPCPHVAGVFN